MERTNVFGNLMVYIQLVKSKLLTSFIVPIISLLDSRALSQIAIFAFLDLTEESNDIFLNCSIFICNLVDYSTLLYLVGH